MALCNTLAKIIRSHMELLLPNPVSTLPNPVWTLPKPVSASYTSTSLTFLVRLGFRL